MLSCQWSTLARDRIGFISLRLQMTTDWLMQFLVTDRYVCIGGGAGCRCGNNDLFRDFTDTGQKPATLKANLRDIISDF